MYKIILDNYYQNKKKKEIYKYLNTYMYFVNIYMFYKMYPL